MYHKFDSATGMSLKSICTLRACTSSIFFFYYKTVSTSGRYRKSVPKGEANMSEGPDPKGLALGTF